MLLVNENLAPWHREACPVGGCGKAYTMQAVADPARLKTNPRPKWPVPEEVIEWQPSYVQRGAQISFNIQYSQK